MCSFWLVLPFTISSLQCHHELYKIGLNEFDIFLGSKLDVRNPAPTRYAVQSQHALQVKRPPPMLLLLGIDSGSRQ